MSKSRQQEEPPVAELQTRKYQRRKVHQLLASLVQLPSEEDMEEQLWELEERERS